MRGTVSVYSIELDTLTNLYSDSFSMSVKGEIFVFDAFVDTGAAYTTICADSLNAGLKERDFINQPVHYSKGIISAGPDGDKFMSPSYDYCVDSLSIGNIVIRNVTIRITFDKRVRDNLVGSDILRRLNYLQFENTNTFILFKSKDELIKYIRGTYVTPNRVEEHSDPLQIQKDGRLYSSRDMRNKSQNTINKTRVLRCEVRKNPCPPHNINRRFYIEDSGSIIEIPPRMLTTDASNNLVYVSGNTVYKLILGKTSNLSKKQFVSLIRMASKR